MKKTVLAVLLAGLVFGAPALRAQDKKPEVPVQVTPLRVQVVFTEYDGEKKIGSLPYTLLINADDKGAQAALRMGLRVPIDIGAGSGTKQVQYMDVGTNMDGRADKTDDGKFNLKLNVERSSLYAPGATEKPATFAGNAIIQGQPVVQQFRSQVNLLIRDGQTVQSTVASDPVNGHVTKVDVTLNVIK